MSFPSQVAVDAAFATFGEVAVIDPDFAALSVTVIRSSPDADLAYGEMRAREPGVILELRATEAAGYTPGFREGLVISVNGERRVLKRAPEYRDPDRLVLTLDTAREVLP